MSRLTLSQRPKRVSYRKSCVRGGAMLGLIVGLIIGLAVALGVAMYVAKVPIPFVNNVPVPNNEQNNAEAQKNSNWNPNATLQTHGPVLPASGASSAAPGAQPDNAPAQPVTAPPPQPVTVPPPVEVAAPSSSPDASVPVQAQRQAAARPIRSDNEKASSGDRLGDFAAAHTQADAGRGNNASPAAEAYFVYFVQTGAFRTAQDADAERARLALLGMDAAITERDQAGRAVYRVRVGPFQNKAAADQINNRLTGNGFEAALVRVPR